MLRIKLNPEDRERLGAPEAMEYNPFTPRLKEVRELKRQCGMTVAQFHRALADYDYEAAGIVAWLALMRHGVNVPWEDFDIDFVGMGVEEVTEDPNPSAPTGASTS